MFGIFALLGHTDLATKTMKQYCARIQHRGPDNTKYFIDDNMFLGFHRLSINGLGDESNQPFTIFCQFNRNNVKFFRI